MEKFDNEVNKKIDVAGGMTPERVKLEQRMAQWTPRQKAAFDFLNTFPAWKEMLTNLTQEKLDNVEKWASNPATPKAKYEDKTGLFEQVMTYERSK